MPSDYETDTAIALLQQQQLDLMAPPPLRTNAQLNLGVIQRHNPSVIDILSIAPYAVVYLFSPVSQQWEKSGVEGTLFVCRLSPNALGRDRYSVIILNRRGLDNFSTELKSGDDVDVTDEYVILQVAQEDSSNEAEDVPEIQIFGLWIFSEPEPSSTAKAREINAQIIQHCAKQAEISRKIAEEQQRLEQESLAGSLSQNEETTSVAAVPMGRQLSLRELFGQQREQDSGWSIQMHNSPPTAPQMYQSSGRPQFASTPDTDFFRAPGRYTPQRLSEQ